MDRIIGQYSSGHKGPLLIIIGAMHGNEVAGPAALSHFFNLIDNEKSVDPDFFIKGAVVGIYGNLQAFQNDARYVDYDMNRAWFPENILNILNKKDDLNVEDHEIKEIMQLLVKIVAKHDPSKLIILDLHTTSSEGGIFTIPSDHQSSQDLSKNLVAPVILGMLEDVKGTAIEFLVNYFNRKIECQTLVFESGQHKDPLSEDRALAAIVNLMRSCGIVDAQFVEAKHTKILEDFSKNLPKVFKLNYKHLVKHTGEFIMKSGFNSFNKIKGGDLLAQDGNESIFAKKDGRILMPLYQKQGEDGFFIIEEEII